MVEFGKTLNEVVKRDWRCHALAYIELKRCLCQGNVCILLPPGLSGEQLKNRTGASADDHSVHTESSFKVSEEQKDEFFRIYDDSIQRLIHFYEDRLEWSVEEKNSLEVAVEKCINQTEAEGQSSSSSSLSFLIHRVTDYSKDLGLVLEFLDLNATAFSKILKKYDKRTGSLLRESKLKELKGQYPCLYGGVELKNHRNIAKDWIKQLESLLEKDAAATAAAAKVWGHGRRLSRQHLHLSLRNSFADGEELKLDNPQGPDSVEDTSTTERIDNLSKKKEGSVRFKVGTKQPQHGAVVKKHISHTAQSSSVHKTKDSQILLNMIEKINEELCLQQVDSPFFDDAQNFNTPPTFMSSEVELDKILGEGEFCKIFEVSKFNVPESCHICFLHRGFNDPKKPSDGGGSSRSPVRGLSSQPTHKKVPSSVILNIADVALDEEDNEDEEQQLVCLPTRSESPQPRLSIFGPFQVDENISDYDELESDHEDDAYDQNNTRGFMKDHCLRDGEARYAVKRIRHDLVGEEEITDAAIDLAREAQFLAGLSHPNIIKIRGTSNIPGHPKFCIILDRLYDTLEVQMLKWKEQVKRHQGKFKGLIGKKKEELNMIWMARLLAAYDLSHAMSYLHKRGILHRDIKPANIGFDIRGDIKIFDFGLAKELKPCDREGQDQYHSSGLAGTRRYMAPEVAEVSPYGFSADVYSFAILLWEMLTLNTAFEKYSRERHYKEIIVEGKRPKLLRSWPFVIKNLLQRCWAATPSDRPTFQSVCEKIKFGLPEQTLRSDRSTDSLMKRSVKSISNHKESFKTPVVEGGLKYDSQSDSLSTSIRAQRDALSDSLSTSIRIKSQFLKKSNT